MKNFLMILGAVLLALPVQARDYVLRSPDGKLNVTVQTEPVLAYTLSHEGETLIAPSAISMETDRGVWGGKMKVRKCLKNSVNTTFDTPLYKRACETDIYNEMVLESNGYKVVMRLYDEGFAYRFVASGKNDFIVHSEKADFHFAGDPMAWVPYVRKTGDFDLQFFNTFENTYVHDKLSNWESGRLAFLPLMVEFASGKKICITESDLNHYPGMYLYNPDGGTSLEAVFAPYPKKERQGSHDPSVTVGGHNKVVVERESYIAKCCKGQAFPWRVVCVATEDVQLLDNNLVYKLASPSVIQDPSWIKPGLVAWEWWNDRNIIGVDFEAGVNNETYEYYIDFASKNGIPYVVLDDGWYDAKAGSAFAVVPEIDLKRLIQYADERNVGLMLWVGYYVFDKDMEKIIGDYARMGIKGFKLDAIGRDDQKLNEFYYKAADIALRNKVILDFHGGAKPAGLNRTYPNVLNFEGVHGLEQLKNKSYDCDIVAYDLQFPFIRGVAGPADYTQGAMKNGTWASYRSIWSEPMSQGTRCRQLAEYIVFDSPLNMLCDSPSNYIREQECTDFLTSVPTVWKETKAIDGKVGEYITMARKDEEGNWYAGGLASWAGRTLELDLSFLGEGNYKAVIFRDGVNAGRNGNDYKRVEKTVRSGEKLEIVMAPGGGFAVKFSKQ